MAKTDAPQPRRDRGATSYVPALVALVAVAVFLGWLATRQPTDTGVAVVEPGDTAADAAAVPTGTPIAAEQLSQQGGRPLVGQNVELPSVRITSAMGQHFVWIELPDGSPYLVRLDPAVVQQGAPVAPGRDARIIGRVELKDEAVLAGWEQEGVLQDEGHRMQAEFGTTYIHARLIQPAAE